MGIQYSQEKDPIRNPIDDGIHNKQLRPSTFINETTGNVIHSINTLRQQTTEQVPNYDLQLSFPQVEETFKLTQLQQSGQYIGNTDVNVMDAANRQVQAIQQRAFQNQRQEGINWLVSPDYQVIEDVTNQSNIVHNPNYQQAILDGYVQQENDLIELPYKVNNISKLTPYINNLSQEQQDFVQKYLSCSGNISSLRKTPQYKSLNWIQRYKLDCLLKKQQHW